MNKLNISKLITSVLVISIIAVAIEGISKIDFKSVKFKKSSKEVHDILLQDNYLVEIENINLKDSLNNYFLVDSRSSFDFTNGHIDGAVNIFAPTFLESETIRLLKKKEKEGKTIVLYSHTRQDANGCWCLLTKLGFDNIKILNTKTAFINNNFEVTPFKAEILKYDITKYLKESNEVKKVEIKIEAPKPQVKVVKPEKKVKVEIEEGGC